MDHGTHDSHSPFMASSRYPSLSVSRTSASGARLTVSRWSGCRDAQVLPSHLQVARWQCDLSCHRVGSESLVCHSMRRRSLRGARRYLRLRNVLGRQEHEAPDKLDRKRFAEKFVPSPRGYHTPFAHCRSPSVMAAGPPLWSRRPPFGIRASASLTAASADTRFRRCSVRSDVPVAVSGT